MDKHPLVVIVGQIFTRGLAINSIIDDGTKIFNNITSNTNSELNPLEKGLKGVLGDGAGGIIYVGLNVADMVISIPQFIKGVGKVGSNLVDMGKDLKKYISKVPDFIVDFKGTIKEFGSKIQGGFEFSTPNGIKVDLSDIDNINRIDAPELNDVQKNYNKVVNGTEGGQ